MFGAFPPHRERVFISWITSRTTTFSPHHRAPMRQTSNSQSVQQRGNWRGGRARKSTRFVSHLQHLALSQRNGSRFFSRFARIGRDYVAVRFRLIIANKKLRAGNRSLARSFPRYRHRETSPTLPFSRSRFVARRCTSADRRPPTSVGRAARCLTNRFRRRDIRDTESVG